MTATADLGASKEGWVRKLREAAGCKMSTSSILRYLESGAEDGKRRF